MGRGAVKHRQTAISRTQLDAAATPKLFSTTVGLDKHYAAVKMNKHKKTKISKFPRSNPDHFYGFKVSKYTPL